MKTPALPTWIVGLALTTTCLSGALAQNEPKSTPPAPVAATPAAAPKPAAPAAKSVAPAKLALPPNLRLSAWTKEIVKLAEAGIDADVMLSFVDNSGTFNLGADQIIYLSDLGVPSPVINAMLQHDQEVIAGVRMLTISSDPGYEPLVELKVLSSTNAPAKTTTQPATAPSPPTPAKTEVAVAANEKKLPDTIQSIADVLPAAPQYANVTDSDFDIQPAFNHVRQSPEKKKTLYPVRSPHPEQLLPPILVIKSVTRTPNLFIIEGFAPSER